MRAPDAEAAQTRSAPIRHTGTTEGQHLMTAQISAARSGMPWSGFRLLQCMAKQARYWYNSRPGNIEPADQYQPARRPKPRQSPIQARASPDPSRAPMPSQAEAVQGQPQQIPCSMAGGQAGPYFHGQGLVYCGLGGRKQAEYLHDSRPRQQQNQADAQHQAEPVNHP